MTSPRPIDSFFDITYNRPNQSNICSLPKGYYPNTELYHGLPTEIVNKFADEDKLHLLESPSTRAICTCESYPSLESLCLTSIPCPTWLDIPTKQYPLSRILKLSEYCTFNNQLSQYVVYCSSNHTGIRTWKPVLVYSIDT